MVAQSLASPIDDGAAALQQGANHLAEWMVRQGVIGLTIDVRIAQDGVRETVGTRVVAHVPFARHPADISGALRAERCIFVDGKERGIHSSIKAVAAGSEDDLADRCLYAPV